MYSSTTVVVGRNPLSLRRETADFCGLRSRAANIHVVKLKWIEDPMIEANAACIPHGLPR